MKFIYYHLEDILSYNHSGIHILNTYLIFRLIVGDREAVGHLDRVLVNSTWENKCYKSVTVYSARNYRCYYGDETSALANTNANESVQHLHKHVVSAQELSILAKGQTNINILYQLSG